MLTKSIWMHTFIFGTGNVSLEDAGPLTVHN